MNKQIVLLLFFVFTLINAHHHRITLMNAEESLLTTRCKSICSVETKDEHKRTNCNVEECVKNSLQLYKYGDCPVINNKINKFDNLCINICNDEDYKCPDIQKCCSHQCGKSCQEPDNLVENDDLPPIPKNITLKETDLHNVNIAFDLASKKKPNRPILFVLEVRAHIGKVFAEHKLGDWKWITFQHRYDTPFKINETFYTRTVGQIKLRIGRWYQFRVASININGTKGYSEISKEFQLKDSPSNPKKPKFLKINKIVFINSTSTYHINIKWSSPKSDIPIEKYKITWSLFLKSKIKNHSLWMEHAFVYEPQRSFEITKLLANSSYFIQVQAIFLFGRKRFVSDKKSKIVNTTFHEVSSFYLNNNDNKNLILANDNRNNNKDFTTQLNVTFLPDLQYGFFARIVWDKNLTDSGKTILDLCHGNESCFKRKFEEFRSIHVKENSYDFTNLRFSSYYTVRLKQFGKYKSNTKIIQKQTIQTPSCRSFLRRYPYLRLNCE